MKILSDLKMYGRFAWGLRDFLRHTITLDEAKTIVRQRMVEREANFLLVVNRGIYGYLKSPYLPLLKLAGCQIGDIEAMVRNKGLESTLLALRESGIYFTFEEFKGLEPVVRNGRHIPVKVHDFDNPFLRQTYEGESGGTATGAGTRVQIELNHLVNRVPYQLLSSEIHGLLGVPTAIWFGVLPDPSGISNVLRGAHAGNIPEKWFSPVLSREIRPSLKNRLANQMILTVGRAFGTPLPDPEPVHLDQAAIVAQWVVQSLKTHGACLIRTHVSKALRICLSAQKEGLDFRGATFMGGGEVPTPTKVREITRTGARWIPIFSFAEAGSVGIGCAQPLDPNDLHFLKDSLALVLYPRQVPGTKTTVNALTLTTLLPTAPKVMLNVETDDYGVIETRSCGCGWETYGFHDHIRSLRSFRKLTGEGVTLIGSEMVHILEEVLPARFGGSPLDYQLMEEEDEKGFTRLTLIVSPKINIPDETKLSEVILEALGKGSDSADLSRAMWNQAKTLRVKRMEPIWTDRGKLMPLHLVHHPKESKGVSKS
jgi:hypothetical protein